MADALGREGIADQPAEHRPDSSTPDFTPAPKHAAKRGSIAYEAPEGFGNTVSLSLKKLYVAPPNPQSFDMTSCSWVNVPMVVRSALDSAHDKCGKIRKDNLETSHEVQLIVANMRKNQERHVSQLDGLKHSVCDLANALSAYGGSRRLKEIAATVVASNNARFSQDVRKSTSSQEIVTFGPQSTQHDLLARSGSKALGLSDSAASPQAASSSTPSRRAR